MQRAPEVARPLFLLLLVGCTANVEATSTEPGFRLASLERQAAPTAQPTPSALPQGWTELSAVDAPVGREDHTAVWTGTEMIVWGGEVRENGIRPLATGARYNPVADRWTAMSMSGAPDPRDDHAVVWTGREMIVWGGNQTDEDSELLASGGRYDPATDRWTPVALGPLSARDDPTAVWTGDEMIVWGGRTLWRRHEGSGARYDPARDQWHLVTGKRAPSPREDHTAVWTGTEMLVWGGWSGQDDARRHKNDGARYDPRRDRWTRMTTHGAPSPREDHTAVWTGTEMLVWGGVIHRYGKGEKTMRSRAPVGEAVEAVSGEDDDAPMALDDAGDDDADDAPATEAIASDRPRRRQAGERAGQRSRLKQLATGALYNPATDTWRPISTENAPKRREDHVAVWLGSELFVWGGRKGKKMLAHGALYNPTTDTWRELPESDGQPAPRWNHSAVLAADQVLVWGGFADGYDSRLARYVP